MFKTKNVNLILATVFTLALYAPCASAGVYSWTDQNGVRHSSDVPPSEYMKQKKEATPPVDDELSPEVTQTLFNKKGKPAAPETDTNQTPPEYKLPQTKPSITPPPQKETPGKKQAVKPPPKPETPLTEKSTAPLKAKVTETQIKKPVPPPAPPLNPTLKPAQVHPQPLTRERIRFYRNQVARLKELIHSQEELVAENVRTIGLIENRMNQIKSIRGPKSDRLKDELLQSEKSLEAAKNRLKTDVRELQVLQNNLRNYQLKLKPAQ